MGRGAWSGRSLTPIAAAALVGAACAGSAPPCEYPGFDALGHRAPRPPLVFDGVEITEAEYGTLRRWGEEWFREETLGNEHLMTDVVGVLAGTLEVPCASGVPGCYEPRPVFAYVAQAIDALDGQPGNLFAGNVSGGRAGVTSDLAVRFPKGSRLHGGIEVPEIVHLGLDVEVGAALPIGVVAVPAPPGDRELPYLIHPDTLGVGPAPGVGPFRLGLTCAVCHYSLDIDWDGAPDLESAWSTPPPGHEWTDHPSARRPGRFRPQDAWGVGNQDIDLGWIFGLSANPVAGYLVLGSPVHERSTSASREWATWVRDNVSTKPREVLRAVVTGMLAEVRGSADDTPDARLNPMQLPVLFTYRNWPYNIDGSQVNATDRNNSVWTVALEFSSMIAAASDRGGHATRVLGAAPTPYADLTARQLAETMVALSPAALHGGKPAARRLVDDILGESDGVPGLLDPQAVVVMRDAAGVFGTVPKHIVESEANRRGARLRSASQYRGDAEARARTLAVTGIRVRTPPHLRFRHRLDLLASRRGFDADELLTNAVSLMLDSLEPPTNPTELLRRARPLLKEGQRVHREAGCATCHRGPFFTDNLVHGMSKIGTRSDHTVFTRELQLGAPEYDPKTGIATRGDVFSFFTKLFTERRSVGVRTLTHRYLWGTAPYLHDGSVAVSLRPGVPASDDLAVLLRTREADKVWGVSSLHRTAGEPYPRANAALSLQAMVLAGERTRLRRALAQKTYRVPGHAEPVSLAQLGMTATGHDFYIDDVPGGPKVTALVAFLLALDDNPGDTESPPVAPRCE